MLRTLLTFALFALPIGLHAAVKVDVEPDGMPAYTEACHESWTAKLHQARTIVGQNDSALLEVRLSLYDGEAQIAERTFAMRPADGAHEAAQRSEHVYLEDLLNTGDDAQAVLESVPIGWVVKVKPAGFDRNDHKLCVMAEMVDVGRYAFASSAMGITLAKPVLRRRLVNGEFTLSRGEKKRIPVGSDGRFSLTVESRLK